MTTRTIAAAILALVVIGGCTAGGGGLPPVTQSPSVPAPPPESPLVSPRSEPTATTTEPPTWSASPEPSAAAKIERPWATATLTDVSTGETFRVADLVTDGKTVAVEAMAIWCTNCRAQQAEFTAALERLDPARIAYVVLTIEPGETAQDLAAYKDSQGFRGMYAVAGREVSAALEADFGPTVLNPPTVPIIIIRRDGSVEFRQGPHPADDIVRLLRD
jgi:thiol-disulfide isomerase/thioredoxin